MHGTLTEPARKIPVAHECDICVIGGSCTGVFAAVRAARLGAKVAIVESHVIFGGMATAAMVNEWHSTLDVHNDQTVIAGLTAEMIERLRKRDAVQDVTPIDRIQYRFNSAEMAGELDRFVVEHGIRAFLAARFVTAIADENEPGKIVAAVIEDKSGRRAIKAKMFIDASGDGDLIRRAGFGAYRADQLQPVTLVALMGGLRDTKDFWNRTKHLAEQYGYPLTTSFPWIHPWLGTPDLCNVYGPRLNGVDASDADALTETLLRARQMHRALADMGHEALGTRPSIAGWAHALGVRETWHAKCLHQLTGHELLHGEPFPDAIANGVYPVDIHHPNGTLLRYIDGREEVVEKTGARYWTRWRAESEPTPRCYHVPFRSLVPVGAKNVLVAGRCLDADRDAFGGARVMVNMNQTGEATGVASWLALNSGLEVANVDVRALRSNLASGGSVVL